MKLSNLFFYIFCVSFIFFIVDFKIMTIELYLIFETMEIMSREHKKKFFLLVYSIKVNDICCLLDSQSFRIVET